MEVIEDPVLKQRYRFRRVTGDDGVDFLEVEAWVDPGGGVTPHVHPAMEERFEVLVGRPSFLAGQEWREAGPGETVVVPPGVRHAFRNDGAEVAHFRCESRPPLRLQEFLTDVARLSQSGKITGKGLPRSPAAALEAIALAHEYRDTVVLLFPPMPPPAVQRLLFPPLARLRAR
jgi:quercetin dioxygenase-like cupin family protein